MFFRQAVVPCKGNFALGRTMSLKSCRKTVGARKSEEKYSRGGVLSVLFSGVSFYRLHQKNRDTSTLALSNQQCCIPSSPRKSRVRLKNLSYLCYQITFRFSKSFLVHKIREVTLFSCKIKQRLSFLFCSSQIKQWLSFPTCSCLCLNSPLKTLSYF